MVNHNVERHTQWVFEGPETQGYFDDLQTEVSLLRELQLRSEVTEQEWTNSWEMAVDGICYFLNGVEERFSRPWFECMFSQVERLDVILSGLLELSWSGMIPEQRMEGVAQKRMLLQTFLPDDDE